MRDISMKTSRDLLWDVNKVAAALSISPHTVRSLASKGVLQRVKLGSRTLFDPNDVKTLVKRIKLSHGSSQLQLSEPANKPRSETPDEKSNPRTR
jgi:hypothetical protein